MNTRQTFRAGDRVAHGPSGEQWVLAVDEEHGRVSPLGWPACEAQASDCVLVTAASDEVRLDTLRRMAAVRERDFRARLAIHQLAKEQAS